MLTGLAITLLLATMSRSLEGTLMVIDDAEPARLTINVARQFQTFAVAPRAVVERESRMAGRDEPTLERIALTDLTPGESVDFQLDVEGRIERVRAVARVERAMIRSVNGRSVVLENGSTLVIGPTLRFVDAGGRPSPVATVRPGQPVLLFHHPQTANVYRFSAEPRMRKPKT